MDKGRVRPSCGPWRSSCEGQGILLRFYGAGGEITKGKPNRQGGWGGFTVQKHERTRVFFRRLRRTTRTERAEKKVRSNGKGAMLLRRRRRDWYMGKLTRNFRRDLTLGGKGVSYDLNDVGRRTFAFMGVFSQRKKQKESPLALPNQWRAYHFWCV